MCWSATRRPTTAPPAPGAPHQGVGRGRTAPTRSRLGKLQKVDAFGHVVVAPPTDVVTGDRGVYVPDTGIAGWSAMYGSPEAQNQLKGSEAQVNMKTGVPAARQRPGGRVARA